MTTFEKHRKEELESLKEKTKPVDAMPIFKKMMEISNASKEEKEELMKIIRESFDKGGKAAVHRAILEGDMTEKEYLEIKEKYGFEFADFSTILTAYYSRKDNHIKTSEKLYIVATPDALVYKHKSFIKERFKIEVVTSKEAMNMMEKEKNGKNKNT